MLKYSKRIKKSSDYLVITFALAIKERDLAQLVAHTSGGREVAGSSPVIPTIFSVRG